MGLFGNNSNFDHYVIAPIPERLKKNRRVLIITADDVEDLEFFYPYYRLSEAGYTVQVATPDGGEFKAKHGYGLSETLAIEDVNPAEYDLLYIPGGKAPAELRNHDAVLDVVRQFAETGKAIAAICHGAQVLISAGLVEGKRISAWPEIEDEIAEAGGIFADEALVEDGHIITARKPGDLHRHLYGVMDYLEGHTGKKKANRTRPADIAARNASAESANV